MVLMFHFYKFTDANCNPGMLGIIGVGGKKDINHFDAESIIGLVVWLLCVLYSSIRSASSSSRLSMSEHVLVKDNGAGSLNF